MRSNRSVGGRLANTVYVSGGGTPAVNSAALTAALASAISGKMIAADAGVFGDVNDAFYVPAGVFLELTPATIIPGSIGGPGTVLYEGNALVGYKIGGPGGFGALMESVAVDPTIAAGVAYGSDVLDADIVSSFTPLISVMLGAGESGTTSVVFTWQQSIDGGATWFDLKTAGGAADDGTVTVTCASTTVPTQISLPVIARRGGLIRVKSVTSTKKSIISVYAGQSQGDR